MRTIYNRSSIIKIISIKHKNLKGYAEDVKGNWNNQGFTAQRT